MYHTSETFRDKFFQLADTALETKSEQNLCVSDIHVGQKNQQVCLMTKIIDAADAVIQKITAFGVSDNDGRYKNTWVRLCALLEAAI